MAGNQQHGVADHPGCSDAASSTATWPMPGACTLPDEEQVSDDAESESAECENEEETQTIAPQAALRKPPSCLSLSGGSDVSTPKRRRSGNQREAAQADDADNVKKRRRAAAQSVQDHALALLSKVAVDMSWSRHWEVKLRKRDFETTLSRLNSDGRKVGVLWAFQERQI